MAFAPTLDALLALEPSPGGARPALRARFPAALASTGRAGEPVYGGLTVAWGLRAILAAAGPAFAHPVAVQADLVGAALAGDEGEIAAEVAFRSKKQCVVRATMASVRTGKVLALFQGLCQSEPPARGGLALDRDLSLESALKLAPSLTKGPGSGVRGWLDRLADAKGIPRVAAGVMHYNGFVAMSDEALGLAEKIVKGECGAERWEEVNEAPWIAEPPISASRGLDAIDAAYLSDRGPASYSGRLLAASALFTATTSVSLHFHGAVPAGCRHLYLRFREHAWATRGGAVGGMEAEVWAPDGTLVLVERQTRAAVGRVPVQAARM